MSCNDLRATYLDNPNNIVVGDVTFYFDEYRKVYWLPNGICLSSRIRATQIARQLNKSIQRGKNGQA